MWSDRIYQGVAGHDDTTPARQQPVAPGFPNRQPRQCGRGQMVRSMTAFLIPSNLGSTCSLYA